MFVFLLPKEYRSRRADPKSGGRVLRLQSKMLAHGLLGNFRSIAGMFGMSLPSWNLRWSYRLCLVWPATPRLESNLSGNASRERYGQWVGELAVTNVWSWPRTHEPGVFA